jgi:HEAT repeat protein
MLIMKRSLQLFPRIVRSLFVPKPTNKFKKTPPLVLRRPIVRPTTSASLDAVLRNVIAVDVLIANLNSPDADTARDAAVELGRSGNGVAVEPLMNLLANPQAFHPVVRTAAAASLGQLKDARAVEILIAATDDTTAGVSEGAALALGVLRDSRAIEPLIKIVANRSKAFRNPVRRAAVKSLCAFRDARAASVLLSVSVNDNEDPAVRQAAKDVGAEAVC